MYYKSRFLKYYDKKFNNLQKKEISLTESQLELIYLLATGLTLHEISIKVNKKENNIKKRTLNLYKKFNVKNRKELIKKAIANNIISTKNVKQRFRKRFLKYKEEKVINKVLIPLDDNEIAYLKLVALGKTEIQIIKYLELYNLYSLRQIKYKILAKTDCKNIIQAIYYINQQNKL